jgi:ABC-type multidrug transport system ATPase subunit
MVRPILSAESIHKSFGRRQVLASAGLWATAGRITVLLGVNGSGKTTLLRIAAGCTAADSGVVTFDGQAFDRPRLASLANLGLFFLPDRNLLSFTISLRQHLEALRYSFPDSQVEDAVERLEVGYLLDRKPKTYSGGERRRAAAAVALARAPRCLLADEALLDAEPTDARTLSRAFRGMAEDGCAVVVAGQEVSYLLELADEVLWMRSGTTERLGPPSEARSNAEFRREYLGEGR